MGVRKIPFFLPTPIKGMNTRDRKFLSFQQARQIVNLRIGRAGRIDRRPGNHLYKDGFANKKFYGFHPYYDSSNIERFLVVNATNLVEFDENNINTRLTGLTDKARAHFVNGLGACFMTNGKEMKKGLDATWAEYGVAGPSEAATVAAGTGESLGAGDYIVKYSYVVKSGSSRLIITDHAYSATVTVGASGKITVSNMHASTNSRVTHKIVWCTEADGTVLYFSQEITNATTTATITAEPSTSGLAYADYANNQSLVGVADWLHFDGVYMWAVDSSDTTNLYRSKNGTHYDLEYFPTSTLVNMSRNGLPIKYCTSINGDIYAMTSRETYRLPDGDINAASIPVSEKIGTTNPFSWAPWGNGIIGLSNIGFVYFDGQNFYPIADDIYNLVEEGENKTTGYGIVIDDPEYGELYVYGATIPSDAEAGPASIQGYLPGSGSGGTGLGLPSDDFDDNSLNTGRWTLASGNASLTEASQKINISKTDASVEDVNITSDYTIDQNINASVEAEVTAHSGSDHDLMHYLKLSYDADNYAMIGYRDVNGTLSIRSKIVIDGTAQTEDVATVPDSTTFRIRLAHNKIETMYKDSVGAWSFADAAYDADLSATGWKIALGIDCDVAGSAPTFTATFDNLRVQCAAASGLEDITPEDTSLENVNMLLVCALRNWKPGIWMSETNSFLQPSWTLETLRAENMIVTNAGDVLHVDSTTGKAYIHSKDDIFDDQEYIPCRLESKILDGVPTSSGVIKDAATIKYILWCKIVGNWGLPFTMSLLAHPDLETDKRTVSGYGTGEQLGSVQMQNHTLANTDGVWERVEFAKMIATADQFIIEKMDSDASFAIEEIDSEINITGARQ